MRTIVFGGAGFLGSYVADALSDAGHKVVIFDLKKSNYLRSDQEMIIGNILDFNQIKEAVAGCDYIYNFAGLADLDDGTTKPLETIRLNIEGNINIVEAALQANVKRFVYASSIYVYSQKGGFYRCSKQASELYIEEYQRRFGLDFTILRFGTLYGPRADKRNSIYRYLKQIMEQSNIVCGGTGDEVREYIYARDAAKLSVSILEEKYKNQHVIITGNHPMKFKEMISMASEISGKPLSIEYTQDINPDHYNYSPYSFSPKIGYKLVNNYYTDMGQGLMECFYDMTQNLECKTEE